MMLVSGQAQQFGRCAAVRCRTVRALPPQLPRGCGSAVRAASSRGLQGTTVSSCPRPAALQHQQCTRPGSGAGKCAAAAGAGAVPQQPAQPDGLFLKKVAGLSLIFLSATVNYTILQSLRDAMIVTSCGAEALPLISAVGVLPASVLFIMYHNRLVSSLDSRAVFYWALAPMAAFYALFAAVLLPNVDALQPTALAAQYCSQLPESLACFVRVAANWVYTAFFIAGELWGSVAISLCFWSTADDFCNVSEAKDVYPKLGILANVGLIAAGAFTRFVSLTLAKDNEVLALQILTAAVITMTAMMCGVKALLDAHVLPHLPSQGGPSKRKQKKKQASQQDKPNTWQLLTSSPRIRNLTLMVMGYGITHKLFGYVWKAQMRLSYPSTAAFASVMGDVAAFTGAATVGLMLTSKFVFQLLGWRGAALATPVVLLASGAVFFAASLFPGAAAAAADSGGGVLAPQAMLALLVALGPAAGLVAQVFGRAAKYSLFDPSKEMVFITMDREEKEGGKAAVDVLGSQVGKTGGSIIMQVALLAFGSMSGALPCAAGAYLAMSLIWLNATLGLARDMQGSEEEKAVMATLDSTPLLAPPTPAKLLPVNGNGSSVPSGAAPAWEVAAPAPRDGDALHKQHQEIKEAMQSHFD